jgi:hypothetical protein
MHIVKFLKFKMRREGLEPSHLSAPDPKSGASTNSATFAVCDPRVTGINQI